MFAVSRGSRVEPAAASERTQPAESPRPAAAPAGLPPFLGPPGMGSRRGLIQPRVGLCLLLASLQLLLQTQAGELGRKHRTRSAGSSAVPGWMRWNWEWGVCGAVCAWEASALRVATVWCSGASVQFWAICG